MEVASGFTSMSGSSSQSFRAVFSSNRLQHASFLAPMSSDWPMSRNRILESNTWRNQPHSRVSHTMAGSSILELFRNLGHKSNEQKNSDEGRIAATQDSTSTPSVTEKPVVSVEALSSEQPKVGPQRKIKAGWHAEQGKREEMEDDVVVEEDFFGGFVYAAVFDGHAGRSTVNFLKEELHEECLEHLDGGKHLEAKDLSEASAALERAFARTDARLLEWLSEHGVEHDSGSTATAVFLRHDRMFVAHLGDSRAVLAQGGNDSAELSEDHRPDGGSNMGVAETQRIKEAGGWVSGGRVCGILAVSRAFGNMSMKTGREQFLQEGIKKGRWTAGFARKRRIDTAWVSSHPDVFASELGEEAEFVIVASDGLWDAVKSSEAVTFVRAQLNDHADPTRACQELVNFAIKERKSEDNVSVVLLVLSH